MFLFCVDVFGLLLQRACHYYYYYQVLVRAYPDLLTRYYDAFAAWKTPEAAMLVQRIGEALVMLRFAALAIPAAVPEDDPRRIAFQTQIGVLRARLLTVGGQAGRDATTGTLSISRGGIGITTLSANQILIANAATSILQSPSLMWDNVNNSIGYRFNKSGMEQRYRLLKFIFTFSWWFII